MYFVVQKLIDILMISLPNSRLLRETTDKIKRTQVVTPPIRNADIARPMPIPGTKKSSPGGNTAGALDGVRHRRTIDPGIPRSGRVPALPTSVSPDMISVTETA
jgi:hypothetical protein